MLPPATEKVWNFLNEQPALAGFVLVGGSALALTIRHRMSEDLDFIFLEPTLPRIRLDALCLRARQAELEFQVRDDEATLEEFLQGGLELHDYQQDFLVNGAVKVWFFVADDSQVKVFARKNMNGPRVASLAELFKSKALVSAVRSKTRDWFDLYLLMREHGFTIRDYQDAFLEAGIPSSCDIGLARLCSGVPQKNDEGYAHLMAKPPTLNTMRSFFIEQRSRLEIECSADIASRKSKEIL